MSLSIIKQFAKAVRVMSTLHPRLCKSLTSGVAASTEHFEVLKSLGSIDNIIDIGANRGQFSLAARYIFPRAAIYAFEPLPKPCETYRDIFASDDDTTVYNTAIGIAQTTAVIHVSGRDDSSSLLPITDTQDQLFPGTGEVGTTTIQVDRLDSLLSQSQLVGRTLLKIDVQGYEAQVLRGSEGLLNDVFLIYIECSFVELYESQALANEVIDWLHQRGFILNGVFNVSYDKNHHAVQADFLFRNSRCSLADS
jgi:FkbM family methyltransferase